jgi:hypothetical protein
MKTGVKDTFTVVILALMLASATVLRETIDGHRGFDNDIYCVSYHSFCSAPVEECAITLVSDEEADYDILISIPCHDTIVQEHLRCRAPLAV